MMKVPMKIAGGDPSWPKIEIFCEDRSNA